MCTSQLYQNDISTARSVAFEDVAAWILAAKTFCPPGTCPSHSDDHADWSGDQCHAHGVVMLLEHLGEAKAAARVMQAIEHVTADPKLHTRDLGGTATTAEVTRAVCGRIAGAKGTRVAA